MTQHEAIVKATKLWKKWVSTRPAVGRDGYLQQSDSMDDYRFYDLPTINDSILREYLWHKTGNSSASLALQREVHYELSLLGKIKKALSV